MKSKMLAGIAAVVIGTLSCTFSAEASLDPTNGHGGSLEGYQIMDDKGMLSAYCRKTDVPPYTVYGFGVQDEEGSYTGRAAFWLVDFPNNQIYFALKESDEYTANYNYAAASAVIEKYLPDCEGIKVDEYSVRNNMKNVVETYFHIYDNGGEGALASVSEMILHDLAEKGIISVFYDCDQIAVCRGGKLSGYMTEYTADGYIVKTKFDPETVQAYLDVNQLDCHIEEVSSAVGPAYRVIPDEPLSFEEHFALAIDLYEALGLMPAFAEDLDLFNGTYIHNALERAGDLNVDCQIDVSDAVLLARVVAEDDSRPAVCDTGYLNADVDGDGLVTVMDVTALLDMIADAGE